MSASCLVFQEISLLYGIQSKTFRDSQLEYYYCSSDLGSEGEILSIFQLSSLAEDPEYQLAALQPKNLQSYKLKWLLIVQQKLWLRPVKKFWWEVVVSPLPGLSTLLFGLDPELSLTSNSNKSWEIQLLFKNFKVVLKHFQSLYMNGTNFSSSQHKVGVRQVC